MFSWFTEPPTVSFKYCPRTVAEEFKKDYRADFAAFGNSVDDNHFLFEPENELDEYCSLLEQSLKLLKLGDPLLAQRKVYLGTRIDEQLHTCLSKALETNYPDVGAEFSNRAIWGGEWFDSASGLRYLIPEQVGEIARVLLGLEVDELLSHFDSSQYDPNDWLEDCRAAIQSFKTCFVEAAERQQVILTTVI
ncbi:DUF1877 family protein [Leptolyngbya sp. BC1307]|uniref:DUF1877 family protein n=1 Tax=Leptolyngbya sp. BC1307 TaxID=2029589 RepID=UPI000EFD77D4|nr:DUF1877 family protein [Leptolyngbya sp. BC1307]